MVIYSDLFACASQAGEASETEVAQKQTAFQNASTAINFSSPTYAGRVTWLRIPKEPPSLNFDRTPVYLALESIAPECC